VVLLRVYDKAEVLQQSQALNQRGKNELMLWKGRGGTEAIQQLGSDISSSLTTVANAA